MEGSGEQQPKRLTTTKRIKSILSAFGCALFLSLSSYAAKNVEGVEGLEVVALRGIITIMIIGPYIQINYGLSSLKLILSVKRLLFMRCFGSLVGSICIYTGVRYIDLPDFTSIQYTYLLLTAIAARVFLKEKLSWVKGIASVFAFLGVILITQPSLFVPGGIQSGLNETAEQPKVKMDRIIGVALAATSALASATVICTLRKLVVNKEDRLRNTTILFCSGTFSAAVLVVVSIAYRLSSGKPPNPTTSDVLYILLVSVSAMIGQLMLTYSLKNSNASYVAIIRSSAIVFSFAFQAIISPQSLVEKHFVSYIGISIIVASVFVVCIVDLIRKSK